MKWKRAPGIDPDRQCPQGHEYTSANTYMSVQGDRNYHTCRTCRNKAVIRWQLRQRKRNS